MIILNLKSKITHRLFFGTSLLVICQSELHYQHHYFSECCYKAIKRPTKNIIDCTGNTDYTWLLDIMSMWFLLKHTYSSGINGIPITKSPVSTADTIPLLHFWFWKPVYYNIGDYDFPSNMTKNVITRLALQDILEILWPFRFLLIKLRRSSSILTFNDMSSPWISTFYLILFVERHITSSNIPHTYIKKSSHFK